MRYALTTVVDHWQLRNSISELESVLTELQQERTNLRTVWSSRKTRYGRVWRSDGGSHWYLVPHGGKGGYALIDGVRRIEKKSGSGWELVWEAD